MVMVQRGSRYGRTLDDDNHTGLCRGVAKPRHTHVAEQLSRPSIRVILQERAFLRAE